MEKGDLGKLERVRDLRAAWASEAGGFTPWLAREENLAVLGEAIGAELELEAQETSVGPFRADILCKDGEDWVLVENQLERTEHVHLGQLLTYASGLEAVTIVWIAGRFTGEHRATLDWLNRITDEKFRFFGLEVELWRIGDSPAAPKFNVVAKPEGVSRSVVRAARGEMSDKEAMRLEYWTKLFDVLKKAGGPVSGDLTPQRGTVIYFGLGRSRYLGAWMFAGDRQIKADVYIDGSNKEAFFFLLQQQQEEIEREQGYPLEWEEKGKTFRIGVYDDADPYERGDWPRQHEWLAGKLNDLHRVFSPRVKRLNLADWAKEEGSGDDSAG